MLHIAGNADLVALWGTQGWPPLLPVDGERAEPEWLYWAANELGPAADHHDLPVVDDLLAEIAELLERLWSVNQADATFAPISASLWGELQRARGAQDIESLGLHGRLLRNTTGLARVGPRPMDVVAAYRAPAARIAGGHLAFVNQVIDVDVDLDPAEVFLQLLAAVLSNRGGHLVAAAAAGGGAPAGIDPGRAGWHPRPAGQVLGSVNRDTDSEAGPLLLLRPEPSVDAVNAALLEAGSSRSFTVGSAGRALADAWLIDTTLRVGPRLQREFHVSAPLREDLDDEPLWRLALATFHPRQFATPTSGAVPGAARLRIIRTGQAG